jgi:HPt (histidine-containing phosphotransfer) domain-containing protein
MTYKYINTEYLESVTGGDSEIMREIIVMFRDQVIEFHREMRSFLDNNDFNSLGLLAHKAKSSVAIMGMGELATILKTLELDAKAGKDPENYPVFIEKFKNDTAEAVRELDDLLNNSQK